MKMDLAIMAERVSYTHSPLTLMQLLSAMILSLGMGSVWAVTLSVTIIARIIASTGNSVFLIGIIDNSYM